MILAFTGHTNLEKVHGYKLENNGAYYNGDSFNKTYSQLEKGLLNFCTENNLKLEDLTIVSGMARGFDEVVAIFAVRNNLDLILSIPHSVSWHQNRDLSRCVRAQAINYAKLLSYSKAKIFEIKKNYNFQVFTYANFARNQHMVDIANYIFSYKAYDSVGTDDCIIRAKQQNKYIGNIYEGVK